MEIFQDFKLKKAYRFIIFKLADDFTSIGVEKQAPPSATYDEFVKSLPKDGCRYAVYDFEYTTADGPRNKLLFFTWYVFDPGISSWWHQSTYTLAIVDNVPWHLSTCTLTISRREPLIYIQPCKDYHLTPAYTNNSRSPDTAKIKPKMIYASSKDGLRKKLDGVYTEIQCTDLSEVSHETVLDKVCLH